MKITRTNLRGLVKEELDRLLSEQAKPFGFTVEYDSYENQYDQTDWYFLVDDGDGEDRSVKILYTGTPNISDIAWRVMDDSGLGISFDDDSPEEMAAHAEIIRQIESSRHWIGDVAEATQAMHAYPGY